jgi:UDPglucose 6-dehydrogenase
MQIAKAAASVNREQRERMIGKVRESLGELQGKVVGILGLSFKPNTNDLREAPSLAIAQALMKEGATVRAYDPAALEEATQILPDLIACRDSYEAATGADGIILMTEWNEFRNLDFAKLKTLVRTPILIDLRNVYESSRVTSFGFRHISVGRLTREPGESG